MVNDSDWKTKELIKAAPAKRKKTSWAWWLLPIFLGLVGTAIAYGCLSKSAPRKAKDILSFGLAWFALGILVSFGIAYWASTIPEEVEPAEKTPATSSQPLLTANEACAHVYDYLNTRANWLSNTRGRSIFLAMIASSRKHFSATYQQNGMWVVRGLGISFERSGEQIEPNPTFTGGLWNFYETSLIVEPANNEASGLLVLMSTYGS